MLSFRRCTPTSHRQDYYVSVKGVPVNLHLSPLLGAGADANYFRFGSWLDFLGKFWDQDLIWHRVKIPSIQRWLNITCIFFAFIHPRRLTYRIWKWWFGSDDFPFPEGPYSRVPAVNLVGCTFTIGGSSGQLCLVTLGQSIKYINWISSLKVPQGQNRWHRYQKVGE